MGLAGGGEDRWVFGYGSLMWRPGFPFIDRRTAVLHGRRRAFCIYSVHHRGTYERPGLVLGLAPGGAVRGMAYRVAASEWEDVYAYLREREQPTETYFETWRDVKLDSAAKVPALVFLSDRQHAQWAGDLTLEQQAKLIAGAQGLSGRNVDYLSDLVSHLRDDGVRDHAMERLLKLVEALEPVGG
ncbi:gamma-glutamylcyclotransferase [Caulobacter segnis]|uniref:glutathione-specific gamma-glutamylcyclotransferase n=1 Tax=Caulobacter segnis TaxID=88688 RepID=A0ABM6TIG6_9CAUL|nr:gamma-glutamylcyclotransferase [Caulobacter segnis]AVQ02987.1 gamma-glutamylcyclotransferase [Caulobacter segnis]